jgi:transporter family protein
MALKTLPITFAAPIRATGPLWTLIGAIIFFAEVPTPVQAVGMAMVIVGCLLFSRSAVEEGFDFAHSKAVLLAFAGTVLGSVSALYDKHLLKNLGIPTSTVLWWFLGGMCMIYVAATFVWSTGRRTSPEKCSPFAWRWTIPLVGILLAASDACYFNAISVPGAKISVLSMIRRASVVLTFFLGGAVFHEVNLPRKAFALAIVLAGVLLLCLVCS